MIPDVNHPQWLQDAMARLKDAGSGRAIPMAEEPRGLSIVKLHKALLEAGVGRSHAALLTSEPALLRTSAMRSVEAFAGDSANWCLVLAGSREAGKTLAAEWLLAKAFEGEGNGRPRPRHIFSSLHVMRARRDVQLLEAMSRLEPLILDDLGVEIPDREGGFLWCLFEIINQRWMNKMRTVVTTNVIPAAFYRRYGERVTDRMRDGGKCIVVKGPSLRAKV